MARHAFLRMALSLALMASLAACSSSKNQNPVGSNEELGKVEDSFGSGEDKPKVYTAREGDTLRKIAGRPEIYGDPNLWPVLQEANADSVGQGTHVNKGTKLKIPRDLSKDQIEEAREKARQHSAASKMSGSKKSSQHSEPLRHEKSVAAEKAKPAPAAHPTVAAVSTPVPPQPVPQAKKGGVLLPVLFVLLLVLAALAVILFYFMKKDSKEENPQ